jgi:hypothetical protein
VEQPESLLRIEVTGSFDRLVLRDPKHRVDLITESGAESTFAGCSRIDMPEQFGIPDSLDYAWNLGSMTLRVGG